MEEEAPFVGTAELNSRFRRFCPALSSSCEDAINSSMEKPRCLTPAEWVDGYGDYLKK